VTSLSRNGLLQSFAVPTGATDRQRRVTKSTDANGNVTTYSFDTDHLTSKTEAYGTPQARTTSYQYLATNTALPTLVAEALHQTSYTYCSGTNNVHTKTVTDLTVTPNVSRTWTYTYDSYGRVLTVDGPRTDVSDITTYTYYTCATGYQCGQVQTVTNAAGQVTTYNAYNAYGQPLTLTDPNGVVTTLTYDARQRVKSRQTVNETTAFDYWPTGLRKQRVVHHGLGDRTVLQGLGAPGVVVSQRDRSVCERIARGIVAVGSGEGAGNGRDPIACRGDRIGGGGRAALRLAIAIGIIRPAASRAAARAAGDSIQRVIAVRPVGGSRAGVGDTGDSEGIVVAKRLSAGAQGTRRRSGMPEPGSRFRTMWSVLGSRVSTPADQVHQDWM
jgi:YD repeat-containing protein